MNEERITSRYVIISFIKITIGLVSGFAAVNKSYSSEREWRRQRRLRLLAQARRRCNVGAGPARTLMKMFVLIMKTKHGQFVAFWVLWIENIIYLFFRGSHLEAREVRCLGRSWKLRGKRFYLVKSQITFNAVRCEENLSFASQDH